MDYEVDFLAVGDGERSGDAIALRFGNLGGPRNEQFVAVIDGGTKDSGEKLVKFVRQRYGADTLDLAVSTHPDGDHASGLAVVLEQLTVIELWMHRPWEHSAEIRNMFRDGRITDQSLDERLRASLEDANELERIAKRKGIRIVEPFAGETTAGRFLRVLGPTRPYYEELLPHFRDCPETKTAAFSVLNGIYRAGATVLEAARKVLESWGIETLTDPEEDATSAENNSSVILLLNIDGQQRVLFTADAGVPALERAASYAESLGIPLNTVPRVQIPHHGSKRNVGPTILDRIIGPKLPQGDPKVDSKNAIASAAPEGEPKHPAKKVLNAFKRRGARCHSTKGSDLCWSTPGASAREGYGPAPSEPFYSEVDE